ncbi:hypothetical protein O9929_15470 [Vibrio lentus]|nr:hypothetical protein [Vibrio lentus]
MAIDGNVYRPKENSSDNSAVLMATRLLVPSSAGYNAMLTHKNT